ncbi:hypothetical protein JKP88DRAFT_279865 [Tribonema minus]|uniref:Rhodanese domain-containing protein n=1 Tax=Tribonema minus TaxID=303371 RepID=A0A835YRN1_9STRA|nr:hypothetical protein JKP88DRAFT_279865 [Tribonema minus]
MTPAERRARNLAVFEALKNSELSPIRVFASPELRSRLRLSGNEKRQRIFLPRDTRQDPEVIMAAVREAFPVGDLPVELWAYAAPSEQQPTPDVRTELPKRVPVTDTNQLAASFAWADAAGLDLNVYLELDPAYRDPDPPAWLVNLPDVSAPREWQMISFYRFVDVPDPAAFAALLTALWRPLGARGRVYVAREGVNAQMAVPVDVVERFEVATASVARLAGVYLNKDSVRRSADVEDGDEAMPFDALHVRVRDQIVADGLATPLDWRTRIGAALSPAEWHARVAGPGAAPGTVVLDCRNDYETDVGAFEAARPLGTAFFRQSWDALRDALVDVPTDAPILTYCTGGIRCVKVAAYLEQELGYTNVARLEGGIVSYARYARAAGVASRFRGKNYVFDGRMAERITEDVLAACHQCGAPCDDQRNCANDRCHTRFIQCPQCAQRYQSCCSNGCVQQRAYEAGLASLSPRVGALAAAEEHGGDASEAQPDALPQQQQRRRRRSPLALQPWLQPQPFQSAPLNLLFDRVIEAHRDGADDDSGDDEIVAALGDVARLGGAKDALVVSAAAAGSSSSVQAVCEALSGAGAAVTLCAALGSGDDSSGSSATAAAWDGDAGSVVAAAAPHAHTGSYDLIVVSGAGDGAERGELYAALMVEGVLSRRGLLALPLTGLSAEDARALRRRVDADKSRVMAATLPVGGGDGGNGGDGGGGILFVGWKGA